jgi:hypothetical protein
MALNHVVVDELQVVEKSPKIVQRKDDRKSITANKTQIRYKVIELIAAGRIFTHWPRNQSRHPLCPSVHPSVGCIYRRHFSRSMPFDPKLFQFSIPESSRLIEARHPRARDIPTVHAQPRILQPQAPRSSFPSRRNPAAHERAVAVSAERRPGIADGEDVRRRSRNRERVDGWKRERGSANTAWQRAGTEASAGRTRDRQKRRDVRIKERRIVGLLGSTAVSLVWRIIVGKRIPIGRRLSLFEAARVGVEQVPACDRQIG